MRIDLHTHAVGHRYSYDGSTPQQLSAKDESDIRGIIEWGLERGLDAMAITDHDLALPGLWGKQYACQAGLSIQIIPGCECELYFQGHWIHILALNLVRPLDYTAFTPPDALAAQIHAQGGICILAHPMLYKIAVYHALKHIVDGIEYRNGAADRRGQGDFAGVLAADGYTGLRLYNSDYHYPDKCPQEQWHAYTEIDRQLFDRWFTSGRQSPQSPPDSRDAAD